MRQDSYFWHVPLVKGIGAPSSPFKATGKYVIQHHRQQRGHEDYSAFTVAELGETLLKYRVLDGICFLRPDRKWSFIYEKSSDESHTEVFADTEADIRAKMLIYLIETNKEVP